MKRRKKEPPYTPEYLQAYRDGCHDTAHLFYGEIADWVNRTTDRDTGKSMGYAGEMIIKALDLLMRGNDIQ